MNSVSLAVAKVPKAGGGRENHLQLTGALQGMGWPKHCLFCKGADVVCPSVQCACKPTATRFAPMSHAKAIKQQAVGCLPES